MGHSETLGDMLFCRVIEGNEEIVIFVTVQKNREAS